MKEEKQKMQRKVRVWNLDSHKEAEMVNSISNFALIRKKSMLDSLWLRSSFVMIHCVIVGTTSINHLGKEMITVNDMLNEMLIRGWRLVIEESLHI